MIHKKLPYYGSSCNSRKDLHVIKLTFLFVCIAVFQAQATSLEYNKLTYAIKSISSTKVLDKIKGRVVDEKGKPTPGVNVRIKGTTKVVSTDIDGNFTLDAVKGDVLQIVAIGYQNKEIIVNNTADVFNITIKESEEGLNEVVVVAYGSQKKATLTGSVTQLAGKDLAEAPIANINNGLQGRLPGLQFQQTSGEPGGDAANINIRGFGSALTIVDGVPTDFTQVNPNDIESITVLKDGAAAMYGFKAANGAIIVTTKRGKMGKPVLSVDAYTGIQGNAIAFPKLVNAGQFVELTNEASINAITLNPNTPFVPPVLPYSESEVQKWKDESDANHKSTDWYNEVLKDYAQMSSLNLSVRGGNDLAKYFIGGGILNQEGFLKSGTSKFKRYNLRSNLDMQITERLKVSLNISARLEDRISPPAGIAGNNLNVIQTIYRTYPLFAPYANNNPQYFGTTNVPGANAMALASNEAGYNSSTWAVFGASSIIEYKIPYVDGLSAKVNFNYEYKNQNYKNWNKQYSLYGYTPTTDSYIIVSTANNPSSLTQGTFQGGIPSDLQLSLNYERTFNNDHHFTGLLLLQRTKTKEFGFNVSRDFSIDALDQLGLGNTLGQNVGIPSNWQTAYMGYAGRINYDYKEKYLAEFGGRYDYSWKFPNGGGFFPEVSAGWVISKESFLKSKIINNLKLKASWARIPDDADFGGFNYLSGYNYPSGSYLFNSGAPTNGLQVGSYANPSLTWLVGTLYNVGLEWGLFDHTITGEFNAFYRKRTGLQATVLANYPSVSGLNPPHANLNEDNTRGFELQLGYNKKIGGLTLNISPNVAYSRTKNGYREDAPAGSAWYNYTGATAYRWVNIGRGYVALGQFQSQQDINTSPIQDGKANLTLRPGDIKYEDINGDGVINGDDQTYINRGSFPKIQYGLNIGLTYKGFDFSALFAGAAHFDVTYSGSLQNPFNNGASTFEFFTDRWRHEDVFDPTTPWIPGKYPSTIAGGSDNNKQNSTFWTKDGSYIRLKTLNVGYTLPERLVKKVGVGSARFYVSGQNLLMITGVKYLDPEALAGNTNGNYYPAQRVYSLGVNVGF